MSTYDSGHHKRGRTAVTHSKDDALTDREFELLLEGASRMDDYYGDQATVAILILGRLGLRRGELAHMQADWLDRRQEMLTIPYHEPCDGARDGDGPCGACVQLAQQRAEYNEDLSLDQALAETWKAKTGAAARDVYYGFSPRVRIHLERFFDEREEWCWAPQSINRRVERAAEHADGLDAEDVRPHALRATAATHHAGRGLEMHGLMQFFGWAQPSTAERYLSRNGQNTARQLDAIHQG